MDDMDKLYREYARTVYKFLLSLNHNEELSLELTQETFYNAVKNINRFDNSCKISTWLCQIAKHLWYQHLRKEKKEIPCDEEIFDVPIVSAEDETISKLEHVNLLKMIHLLPEPYKEVLYLRAFGNLSFKEIGEVLGRTENWSRVTFYRGKEKLKGGLQNEK